MRFVIIISFLLSGCLGINHTRPLTKEVKYNFTNRFEGKSTGLAQKINTAGIYRYWTNDEFGRPQKIQPTGDTAFTDMIFYDDGTFVWNIWYSDGFTNYPDYFKSVIAKGKNDIFYKAHSWGIYSISNDTIKAQHLRHASPGTPWYTGEEWYLIKDRSTLQVIYFGDFDKESGNNPDKSSSYVKRASPVRFIPVNNIPPPYGWIKKESFFWGSKGDWEGYVKSME